MIALIPPLTSISIITITIAITTIISVSTITIIIGEALFLLLRRDGSLRRALLGLHVSLREGGSLV